MKIIFFIAIFLAPGLIFAQTGPFSIRGQIGNLNSPAKAFISFQKNGKVVLDSVNIQNGGFEFRDTVDGPSASIVYISHDGQPLNKIHHPDQLGIYLEAKPMILTPADSVAKANIPDSKINEDNKILKAGLKPSADKYNRLLKQYRAASPDLQKSDTYQKEMQAKADSIDQEKGEAELAFIKNNPRSLISLFALQEYAGPLPADGEKIARVFNSLSSEVKGSPAGKKYSVYIAVIMNTLIGHAAPEFSTADTAGKVIKLSSYRGKYVLLDFWASWCRSCRAENPVVLAVFNKYHPKGLEILSVSLDKNRGNWLAAIHQDHLPWTQVSDLKDWKGEVPNLYGVRLIPQNFLIGPDGKIVAKNLRGDELGVKLEEIYSKM